MKLRNKKTGEIVDLSLYGITVHIRKVEQPIYRSISALNEEWEDYEPAEPLIKDEKIRKAVRAWAEANNIAQVGHDAEWNAFRCTDFVISFDYDFDRRDGLKDMGSYLITELCGEEE